MVSFPYSITICYLGTKNGTFTLSHWCKDLFFFCLQPLLSNDQDPNPGSLTGGDCIFSHSTFPWVPTLPSRKWEKETSSNLIPRGQHVHWSNHFQGETKSQLTSFSAPSFISFLHHIFDHFKGFFFFFFTVISIEFTFSALPMFSQFWTDSMEHQASEWWMDQTRSTIG